MSKAKHKEGIKALQELLPIEDCVNCGADTGKQKKAKRAKLPDHVQGHPNLIG